MTLLVKTVFDQGPVSSATAARIDSARHAVLRHFGASPREWTVVFTSGATASLKMVGEQFPWRPGGTFVHARASHNSVLGVREYAVAGGADVECLDMNDCLRLAEEEAPPDCHRCCCGGNGAIRAADGSEANFGDNDMLRLEGIDDKGEGGDGEVSEGNGGAVAIERRNTVFSAGASVAGAGADGHGAATINGSSSGSSKDEREVVHCLFAFPAECNATGARSDLAIAARVKRGALNEHRGTCCCHRANGDRSPAGLVGQNDRDSGRRSFENVGANGALNHNEEERSDCRRAVSGISRLTVDTGGPTKKRWWVLLDAAKFVGTAPLNLSKVEADFVVLSFYKMFG